MGRFGLLGIQELSVDLVLNEISFRLARTIKMLQEMVKHQFNLL